jgi:hypothetical protein
MPGDVYFQATFTTDGESRIVLVARRSTRFRIPRVVRTSGGWAVHIWDVHVSVRRWFGRDAPW